jgi:peptidoglycan/LPS O-acetylase OafA/YrhL
MANDIIGSLLLTGRYTALFLFGIMLGSKLEDVRLKLRALPLPLHLGLCIAGAAIHVFMAAHNLIGHGYGDVLEGIFAVYLIGCCVSFPRTEAHMSGRVPQWLGDISYSLYLIHLPVLLGVLYLLNSHLPFAVNMAVAIPAMFASAHLMHVYVEKPSIVIARALAPSR